MDVIIHYSRNGTGAKDTAARITADFPAQRVHTFQADMTDPDAVARLVEEAAALGEIAMLVANAGGSRRERLINDISLHDFENDWKLNTRAPFLLCKAFVPAMQQQGWGRIVFVSSIAAHGGGMNGCHYASRYARGSRACSC
jgi:3-oxoacyl-[acyl-carrier protein] reductase